MDTVREGIHFLLWKLVLIFFNSILYWNRKTRQIVARSTHFTCFQNTLCYTGYALCKKILWNWLKWHKSSQRVMSVLSWMMESIKKTDLLILCLRDLSTLFEKKNLFWNKTDKIASTENRNHPMWKMDYSKKAGKQIFFRLPCSLKKRYLCAAQRHQQLEILGCNGHWPGTPVFVFLNERNNPKEKSSFISF